MPKAAYKQSFAANLTLIMHVIPQPGPTVEFVLQNVLGDSEIYLGQIATAPLIGQSVAQLFAQDAYLLDEWKEYLLKHLNNHVNSHTADQEEKISWQSIQFLQAIKKWVHTTLIYFTEGQLLQVDFAPLEAELNLPHEQLINFKQSLWLKNYLDSGGDWEINLADETVFVSRKLAKVLRLAEDATVITLQRFFELIYPDDLPKVQEALAAIETGRHPIYNRGILNDGSIVHLNSYAVPGYDTNGKLTRIVGHSQNISEKEQMLTQLKINEQRFRGIVESSGDLFVLVSADGCISYISPKVTAQMGYDVEAVLGQDFRNFFPDLDERAHITSEFVQVMNDGSFVKSAYQLRHADGHSVWFLIDVAAILESGHYDREVLAVCRDITEEREHEENLRYMSLHDALTGTYNRFHFEREMDRFQQEAVTDFGLIITDINGLKVVNETFGHSRGDRLLVDTAHLLRDIGQGDHAIFRIGGDEFAIFLENCTVEGLEHFCDGIEDVCQLTESWEMPLSISWGAAYRSSPNQGMQALYKQAEERMYSKKLLDSHSMRNQMLSTLKETLKARNVETADHMQRMENMVMALGKRLGLPANEFNRLVLLASLHDIGKVAVPDNIVSKPGPLTAEEWAVMCTHSEVGGQIAQSSQELAGIANEICCHHENFDGSGYPYGHAAEDIPLLSRIISVVDAYDVMTHRRVYKEAIDHHEAIQELMRCSNTQFDPQIVSLFLDIFGSFSKEEMARFTATDPKLQLAESMNPS